MVGSGEFAQLRTTTSNALTTKKEGVGLSSIAAASAIDRPDQLPANVAHPLRDYS
jgi:hypothetical protein